MTIYKGKFNGKFYFAIRFKNDLCVGIGKPPPWMREQAVRDRAHYNV